MWTCLGASRCVILASLLASVLKVQSSHECSSVTARDYAAFFLKAFQNNKVHPVRCFLLQSWMRTLYVFPLWLVHNFLCSEFFSISRTSLKSIYLAESFTV